MMEVSVSEPSEARELPVISPELISGDLIAKVDALVRAGDVVGALDVVDQAVLVEVLGFTRVEVLGLRKQWERLRDRRMGRGRRASA
jgi:hypothetical protein